MQEHLDTKRILAAALKQLTCRKSFDKITIADITQQSGYNRQTFYYHFRDKYELLNWIGCNKGKAKNADDAGNGGK